MREIKFRAWDKKLNKIWHSFDFPDQYLMMFDGTIVDRNGYDWMGLGLGEFVYDRFELMQFTGLFDKNGKEIYEGDIVKISYGTAIVKFINECGAFMLYWIDDNEANMELVAFSNNGYRAGRSRAWEKDIPEIVGNIYQNQELIKK